ncbi:MAG: hypothetical protein RSE99_10710, partial [Comamonas sp.]
VLASALAAGGQAGVLFGFSCHDVFLELSVDDASEARDYSNACVGLQQMVCAPQVGVVIYLVHAVCAMHQIGVFEVRVPNGAT